MTTTDKCICEGRGIIHIQVMPGMWEINDCACRPPEYWAERREASYNEFIEKLERARIELGMVDNDAIQNDARG